MYQVCVQEFKLLGDSAEEVVENSLFCGCSEPAEAGPSPNPETPYMIGPSLPTSDVTKSAGTWFKGHRDR